MLDEASLTLEVAGVAVECEARPLEVLIHLLRHAGEVVTKDELLENVWPGRIPSESVLPKAMAKLRQALGDEDQALIKTVYGYGYRLVVPVSYEQTARGVTPPSVFAAGDHPPNRPNWRLEEPLGGGSRNDVWRARHDKTGDLRVFKFARDADGLRALKREITLYRVLQENRPDGAGFVRIHDWNFEDPPWFLEAEYAAGGSLVEWVERSGGWSAIPVATRLDIVAQIAEMLAVAHDAGVLHKDVKPGNVVVDAPGIANVRVRLTDFGSGKLVGLERLAQLEITRLGFTQTIPDIDSTSGTPLYIAPELMSGQAPSIRSDLYSLGVVLYQMLVGDFRRPLAPGWERDIEDPLLRADVRECSDITPAHRLADASQLATRLRTLDARRASMASEQRAAAETERLRANLERVRARRPWIVAATTVLVLGLALIAVLYVKAEREGARATKQAEIAEREARRNAAVNSFLVEDLLAGADPLKTGHKDMPMTELLARAESRVGDRFRDDPGTEAAVRDAIGNAYVGVSEFEKAREQLRLALTRAESGGEATVPVARRAQMSLIAADLAAEQYDDAKKLAEDLARHTDLDPVTQLQLDTAKAWLVFRDGDYDAAIAALESQRPRYLELLGDDSPEMAAFLERLGETYWTAGKLAPAIAGFQDALARFRKLYGAYDARSINSMQGLGSTLRLADRGEESLKVMLEAREISVRTLGEENDLSLNVAAELSASYEWLKRYDEAEPLLRRIVEIRTRRYGEDHLITRILMSNLANLYDEMGQHERALPMFQHVWEIEKRIGGEDHPDTLNAAHHVSVVLGETGQWQKAADLEMRTLEAARKAYPADYWGLGVMQYSLADDLGHLGRFDESEKLFQESIAFLRKTLGDEHRWTKRAMELEKAMQARR